MWLKCQISKLAASASCHAMLLAVGGQGAAGLLMKLVSAVLSSRAMLASVARPRLRHC